jgi:hypothetical protein
VKAVKAFEGTQPLSAYLSFTVGTCYNPKICFGGPYWSPTGFNLNADIQIAAGADTGCPLPHFDPGGPTSQDKALVYDAAAPTTGLHVETLIFAKGAACDERNVLHRCDAQGDLSATDCRLYSAFWGTGDQPFCGWSATRGDYACVSSPASDPSGT